MLSQLNAKFFSLFGVKKMDNKPIIAAVNLAQLMAAVAALVQEVAAIQTQVEQNAQQVWDEVRTDFADAVAAFDDARAKAGQYHDARQSQAPATPADPPSITGEGEPHAPVTGA
jgi:hypothetical protein